MQNVLDKYFFSIEKAAVHCEDLGYAVRRFRCIHKAIKAVQMHAHGQLGYAVGRFRCTHEDTSCSGITIVYGIGFIDNAR